MKNISTHLLSLIICLELVMSPFPKVAKAEEPSPSVTATPATSEEAVEVTSPDAFLTEVEKTDSRLYGKKGCVKGVKKVGSDKVVVEVFNRTSQEAIHGPEDVKNSNDCGKQVKEFVKEWNAAKDIKKQADHNHPAGAASGICANCGTDKKPLSKDEDRCSKLEKDEIASVEKNDKSCSADSIISKSSFLSSAKDAIEHPKSCLVEFKNFLVAAVKKQYQDAIAAGKATFASHRQVEDISDERARLLSSMPDADVALGAKNPVALTEKIETAFTGVMKSVMTWLNTNVATSSVAGVAAGTGNFVVSAATGLDIRHYIDLYQCAKCEKKTDVLCKVLGLAGKEVVDAAVMAALFYGIPKAFAIFKTGLGKGVEAAALAEGATERRVLRSTVEVGDNFASVSRKATDEFGKEVESSSGQMADAVASVKHIDIVPVEAIPSESTFPSKLTVHGGKEVELQAAEATHANEVFKNTPGVGSKMAKDEGLVAVDKVSSEHAPLDIEMNRPLTQKMSQSKSFVAKQQGVSGHHLNVDDVNNITPVDFEISKSGKGIDVGEHSIAISNPEGVTKVHTFGTAEEPRFLVEKKDGTMSWIENGKVEKKFTKAEAKNISALVDPAEHAKADQQLVKDTIAEGQRNGLKFKEENSSKLSENEKAEVVVDCPPGSKNSASISALAR